MPVVVTSPDATLKTVRRRLCGASGSDENDDGLVGAAAAAAGGGGGGGTEKSARSCDSVSRIREVMSWLDRSALVKILGAGKLGGHRQSWVLAGRVDGDASLLRKRVDPST